MSLFSFSSLPLIMRQKVFFLWISRMVLQMGVVLLSTLILSLFIAYYSEGLLPILLLFQAIFLFIGSIAIMPLLRKISVKKLLLTWISIAGIGLMLAMLIPVFFVEWSLLLVILSFFLWHGLVFFALYIEQIFSPEEAEHAIPLIESGEPIGGILAGLIAALGAYYLTTASLQIIAAILLLLSAVMIFLASWFIEDVQLWHEEKKTPKNKEYFGNEIIDFCILGFKNPLLKKLFWAALIQAIIFVLIEYQYLLAASALVPHHSAESIQSEIAVQLTHGLGLFHVAVFSVLFLIQIGIAQGIQKRLGVIKSLFIQPITLALNALLMILFTLIPLGMMGKGLYEITGGIHKNAIASGFYAFKPEIREEAREFLEGIARPIGMIIGSLLVIIITALIFLLHLEKTILLHVFGMVVIFLAIGYVLILKKAPKDYTILAKRNLQLPHLPEEKFDALEIFSQQGHENAAWTLADILKNDSEPNAIKISALHALSLHCDMTTFSDILAILENSEDEELQLTALITMQEYAKNNKNFQEYPFSRNRINTVLEKLFETAQSKRLRMQLIQIFSMLQYNEILPFLQKGIHHQNTDIAFCSILGCGAFKDISIAPLILPFLEQKNGYLKSAAIIVLWQFARYREILLSEIISMINDPDEDIKMSGIYTAGELQITSEYERLKTMLFQNLNIHIQKHIIIALAKMGDEKQIFAIASLLFHKNESVALSTKKLIYSPGLHFIFEKELQSFIRQKVLNEIRNIAKTHGHIPFYKLEAEIIDQLKWLYSFINAEKMVARLGHFQ